MPTPGPNPDPSLEAAHGVRARFAAASRAVARRFRRMVGRGPVADAIEGERARERAMTRWDGTRRMLIPHQDQFAGKYSTGNNVYWSRFDEALRDNWQNALAMRRSSFIHELLRHRQLPSASLPWHVEVDDPKDPDQQKVSERLTKLIDAIPGFQAMRLYLAEDQWQGKYGSQVTWGTVMIDGRPQRTIVDHEPVDGDSIVYKFDKTPGILVRSGWTLDGAHDNRLIEKFNPSWVTQADRARAIFLHDQFWRDHFVISNFEPASGDFLFEGMGAAGIFGVGFRARIYWDFQLREELRSWLVEALQRIGVNGMLYGFFESGNAASMNQVIQSLQLMIRDNVGAFPVEKGMEPQEVRHIEPSQVGYDVLAHWIAEQEDSMRRAVLGQSLSSQAESTGMGSEVAELHRSTFEHIVRYDAIREQEVLTRDVLGPLVRFNEWEWRGRTLKGTLPFRARIVFSTDKANVAERAQVITTAYNLGLKLDTEQVYEDLGLSPPKDPANVLVKPDQATMPGMGGPGQPGPGGGPGGQPPSRPGKTTVAPGFKVVRKPNGGVSVVSKAALPRSQPPRPQTQSQSPRPLPAPVRRSA